MNQILGLRPEKDGSRKLTEAFRELDMAAPNLEAIFENPEKYISMLPMDQRYNLYMTIAECEKGRGRRILRQNHIAFDIDDIEIPEEDLEDHLVKVARVVCKAIGVPFEDANILYSGNGIWVVIGINNGFTDRDYFKKARKHYQEICKRINEALKANGLRGKADPSAWSPARLMRYPNTLNIKENRPERLGKIINCTTKRINWDLEIASGLSSGKGDLEIDHIYSVDQETIMGAEGCTFMRWLKDNPERTSEPQWYAGLSISSRFVNGREFSHEISKGHPGYSFEECDEKISQALRASGPRTCENISGQWKGCESCPNFGKVTSPIQIQGSNFIRTEKTGFRLTNIDANGNQFRGKPSYEDLEKKYYSNHPYVVIAELDEVYTYKDKIWTPHIPKYREAFAHEILHPKPKSSEIKEFESWIKRTRVIPFEIFQKYSQGFINLRNGVYDIAHRKLLPHSPLFYFTSQLPYDFDHSATAPGIEKFLKDITGNDQETIQLLLEFFAYILFDQSYNHHKALGLIGTGSNGKSTLIEVLCFLLGIENCSFVSMGKISDPTHAYQLLNKKLNISEETPSEALLESDVFKQASAGGQIQMKKLYKDIFSVKNTAKFIFASNHVPQIGDGSYGMRRRLILVPFNQIFKGSTLKLGLKEELKKEASGFLNLLIHAYESLCNRGDFAVPEKCTNLLNEVSEDGNPVLAWYRARIITSDEISESRLTAKEMYRDFEEYALQELGHRFPMSFSSFSRKLSSIIPNYEERKFNDGSQRGLKGLKLKPREANF